MVNGKSNNKGTLFVVATPIGNLRDITLRALEVLKAVDLIACEDTRHTGQMLKHFNINKPLVSYFQHSKLSKIEYIIEQLINGKNIALVTDAGTPAISDPGQGLIEKIREVTRDLTSLYELRGAGKGQGTSNVIPDLVGDPLIVDSRLRGNDNTGSGNDKEGSGNDSSKIKIIPIPGPSALIAAASVSGMIEKAFYFAGFLPKKKGRQTEFKKLSQLDTPVVIYESANRLEKTLEEIRAYFGEGSAVFIAREITKMFEEYWGGKVSEVIGSLKEHQLKGEIVLIVKK